MIDTDSAIDLDPDTAAVPLDDIHEGRHTASRRHHERTAEDTRRAHERASRQRFEQAVLGRRELYIYWKTHDLNAALAAASRMQAVLCSRIDGLEAELLQRDSSADGRYTVIEIYRHPQGIDGPLEALIGNAAVPAVSALMASPRVVEAFRRVEN
jgi:Domain of unknown function (DUF4936)